MRNEFHEFKNGIRINKKLLKNKELFEYFLAYEYAPERKSKNTEEYKIKNEPQSA